MNAFATGILIEIALLFILTLIKKDSKYSKLGINLNRIYCPKCNEKQPIARKPANERQALYGGYTCKNCEAEKDKNGMEIKELENLEIISFTIIQT